MAMDSEEYLEAMFSLGRNMPWAPDMVSARLRVDGLVERRWVCIEGGEKKEEWRIEENARCH